MSIYLYSVVDDRLLDVYLLMYMYTLIYRLIYRYVYMFSFSGMIKVSDQGNPWTYERCFNKITCCRVAYGGFTTPMIGRVWTRHLLVLR